MSCAGWHNAARMIPKPTFPRQQAPLWQHELRKAFARPDELLEFLQLDPALPALQLERLRDFPLRVPRGFAARMKKGDPADPLFLQVWPQAREGEVVAGFSRDAVGDLHKLKPGGLIHKYEGRALVVATGACAVNCRYCFRRHFPYSDAIAARNHWQETLQQLASDPSIEEVILSGGDPLSLSDEKLSELVTALDGLPQLRRLRIHTRQPVVLPERVDEHLLAWIRGTRLQVAIVIHANHANELDEQVAANLKQLRDSGAILLNQSVLLRRVNDTVAALESLSKRLFECGVLPYYLHLLDRVEGAAHFEVSLEEAVTLMQALSSRLSGYLVPRLVREDAGAPSKTLLPW